MNNCLPSVFGLVASIIVPFSTVGNAWAQARATVRLAQPAAFAVSAFATTNQGVMCGNGSVGFTCTLGTEGNAIGGRISAPLPGSTWRFAVDADLAATGGTMGVAMLRHQPENVFFWRKLALSAQGRLPSLPGMHTVTAGTLNTLNYAGVLLGSFNNYTTGVVEPLVLAKPYPRREPITVSYTGREGRWELNVAASFGDRDPDSRRALGAYASHPGRLASVNAAAIYTDDRLVLRGSLRATPLDDTAARPTATMAGTLQLNPQWRLGATAETTFAPGERQHYLSAALEGRFDSHGFFAAADALGADQLHAWKARARISEHFGNGLSAYLDGSVTGNSDYTALRAASDLPAPHPGAAAIAVGAGFFYRIEVRRLSGDGFAFPLLGLKPMYQPTTSSIQEHRHEFERYADDEPALHAPHHSPGQVGPGMREIEVPPRWQPGSIRTAQIRPHAPRADRLGRW
jgi:hypothetical protein